MITEIATALEPGAATAIAIYQAVILFLSDPLWRFAGLVFVVVVTIWAIAQIYSGDLQNAETGPVSIRPHTSTRASLSGVIMPRELGVPFNMDGVSTSVSVLYIYDDARGKRRKVKLQTRDLTLSIQPNKLTKVANTIFGCEVPDVPQEAVCYPRVNLDETPTEIGRTAERAPAYVAENKILEAWTDDDGAVLISVPKALHEEINRSRHDFITDHVDAWDRARNGNFLDRRRARALARKRPNVIGSYYIKFKFKSDPLFVLFRHPDRDLKMTAWLTVLTSAFALLMDAWPKPPLAQAAEPSARVATDHLITRTVRIPN